MRKKPNLFILGAPKCGTTAMAHYLSQHPGIYVSEIKEPHYFNMDSGHRYTYELSEYEALFDEVDRDTQYLCEASVWYLYSEVSVSNILRYNPDAKFIVMLRNPVDMFFSLHQELYYGGSEDILSPIKAWEAQSFRSKGKNIPKGCREYRNLEYGKVCSLGSQCGRLLKQVPRDRVQFVYLEEMANNPDEQYREVLGFLELDIISLENYEVINKKKTRKFNWLNRFFIHWSWVKKSAGIKGGIGLANYINRMNVHDGKQLTNKISPEFRESLEVYFNDDWNYLKGLVHRMKDT